MRLKRWLWLKLGIVPLLLVLISAVAWAQGVPTDSWALGNWVPVAALVVVVAYLVVALAYMIGIGFQYREVVAWADSEFWEASLNAMIVGLCIVLVLMFSDVTTTLTGSPDHMGEAWKYLERIGGDLFSDWGGLLLISEGLNLGASFWVRFAIPIPIIPSLPMTVIPIGPPGVSPVDFWVMPPVGPWAIPLTIAYLRSGSTLQFLAGLQQIIGGFGPLIYAVAVGMFATYAQRAMLTFAQNNMLTVFLPLGIMARSFPLTRKMGGTMIAMALTLYFVYPLTLVLSDNVYSLYKGSNPVGTVMNTGVGATAESTVLNTIIDWMIPTVRHVTIIMFMFVLSVIITITSFRAIAASIGGDPNIFGLGKMGV